MKANPEKMDLRIMADAISDTNTTALQEELVSFASNYKHFQKEISQRQSVSEIEIDLYYEMGE